MDRPRTWRVQGIDLSSEPQLRIGEATIDPISRDAKFGAETERLQPQNLKVLIALARQKGEVVTRDKLIDQCWDGRIVGDDVINHSISVLRTFAARAGGFAIETVPKAGYRLVETDAPLLRPERRWIVPVAIVALLAAAGSWFVINRLHPGAAERERQVHLAGFTGLSADVPPALLQAMRDETLAAFAGDGAIGVTTAADHDNPYQLSGSVERRGAVYNVIVRIDNARSGASLWSRKFDYPASDSEVARDVALNLANMARCGFGRSYTYPRTLPDNTLRLLFGGCENDGTIDVNLDRALDYARRVTIASPDFSAGWSSVAATAVVLGPQKLAPEAAAIAVEADRALDTALRLDPKNSEAWALKSYVLPINRFADREALLKRAIAARPLDCGCEHHAYGLMLAQVGRLRDAAREFKRAVDFQHLNEGLYEALGPAQYAAGDRAAALQTLAAGRKVDRRPHDFDLLRARFAIWDGDFAQADEILRPLMDEPDAQLMGPVIQALQSRDPAAISQEKDKLTALTQDVRINRGLVISLLASLGGVDDALIAVQRLAETKPMAAYRAFFDPAFGRSISEPAYWTTAKKLGLVDYWMTSRQRPDFCTGASAPAGCRSLG